jgi:hypothetical protein
MSGLCTGDNQFVPPSHENLILKFVLRGRETVITKMTSRKMNIGGSYSV